MQLLIKLIVTVIIIAACAHIGRRYPTLAGLLAAAPITTLLAMLWLYSDKPGDYETLRGFAKGVAWGIIPTALFFITAYLCLGKRLPFGIVLSASFAVWLLGAIVHQWLLK
jgi:uncharacterized membrane protein (GlpM family)